jgi:hypothetical protein
MSNFYLTGDFLKGWNHEGVLYFRRKIEQGELYLLSYMFRWGDSPQGKEYWAMRCTGRAKMSQNDLKFLKMLEIMSENKIKKLYLSDQVLSLFTPQVLSLFTP